MKAASGGASSATRSPRSPSGSVTRSSRSPSGSATRSPRSPSGSVTRSSRSPTGSVTRSSRSPSGSVTRSSRSPSGSATRSPRRSAIKTVAVRPTLSVTPGLKPTRTAKSQSGAGRAPTAASSSTGSRRASRSSARASSGSAPRSLSTRRVRQRLTGSPRKSAAWRATRSPRGSSKGGRIESSRRWITRERCQTRGPASRRRRPGRGLADLSSAVLAFAMATAPAHGCRARLPPAAQQLGAAGPAQLDPSALAELTDVAVEAAAPGLAGARRGRVGDLLEVDLPADDQPAHAEAGGVGVAQRLVAAEGAPITRADAHDAVVEALDPTPLLKEVPGLMLNLEVAFGIDAAVMPGPDAGQAPRAGERQHQRQRLLSSAREEQLRGAAAQREPKTAPLELAGLGDRLASVTARTIVEGVDPLQAHTVTMRDPLHEQASAVATAGRVGRAVDLARGRLEPPFPIPGADEAALQPAQLELVHRDAALVGRSEVAAFDQIPGAGDPLGAGERRGAVCGGLARALLLGTEERADVEGRALTATAGEGERREGRSQQDGSGPRTRGSDEPHSDPILTCADPCARVLGTNGCDRIGLGCLG
ncbi:MAG: hypothetical protein CSA65_09730 [Proteobacteria bacterium]|nr:MAG: hypothetical protein CSA65_09730 [Pseudomonadota bacterium]